MLRRSFSTIRTIGMAGIGRMGSHMASNLIKAGYQVKGFDLSSQALTQLEQNGGVPVSSVEHVCQDVDMLLTMLPTHKEVNKIADVFVSNAKNGSIFVDSSTVAPLESVKLNQKLNDKGFQFMDAPVSGGVNGAKLATLTFMVGGETANMERIRPVLEKMGKNIFHCGQIGSGSAVKICNNMALGVQMQSIAEALNLGIKLGLDAKMLTQVMGVSSSSCWSLTIQNPVPGAVDIAPSTNNYEGGFSCSLIAKDMQIALETAKEVNASVEAAKMSLQLYKQVQEAGEGNKDFGMIYQIIKDR